MFERILIYPNFEKTISLTTDPAMLL